MNFAQSVKMTNTNTTKRTENGAFAYSTTQNALLDLFAQIGALRPRSENEIRQKFAEAYHVDAALATKMLFYAGNIRGGLGERRTFRICLKWLAQNHADIVKQNIANIPHFNRWDSLFTLVGTPCEEFMWDYIGQVLNADLATVAQFKKDNKTRSITLLAKWMPTETASAKETKKLAKAAIKELGLTPRQYRKMLSALRTYLNIVERSMSKQEWNAIQYEAVPSYAMKNYRGAFAKHDFDRFSAYKSSLVKGEVKVNASTLFPYDLVGQYMSNRRGRDDIIEAQWKALPNYVSGENNIIVMADVSGSMSWNGGRPMATSVGLATYFAQHNSGYYKNLYMTFTDKPHFIHLRDNCSLWDAVRTVTTTGVGYSTNLAAAFDHILEHAVRNHISPADMPKALVVISDMEIDQYMRPGYKWPFLDTMKSKFSMFGYTLPKIVLWNVEARNDTFLSQSPDVIHVSGQSASSFRNLCQTLDGKTAWDFMLEVLNDKQYDCVKV